MQQAKAARAALMDYPMVAPAGNTARGDEVVAFLNKTWGVPPGLRECDPCRAGLDRQTIEDPAFRNFGG